MYCKNCGATLGEFQEVCENCETKAGYGENFCDHCGKPISRGQALCLSCGFMITKKEEKQEEAKESVPANEPVPPSASETVNHHAAAPVDAEKGKKPEYLKYTDRVKKINIMELAGQVLSLIAILCLVFLPIYQAEIKLDINSLEGGDNIESWEDLENMMQDEDFVKNGVIKTSFSLYDDVVLLVDMLFEDDQEPMLSALVFTTGLMAIFEIIFAIIVAIAIGKKVYNLATEFGNAEGNAMLKFNEIKKTGGTAQKINIFKQQTVFVVVMYAIFDIIMSKLCGLMFEDLFDAMKDENLIMLSRNMMNFSGFSSSVFFPLLLIVGVMIIKRMIKKEEKEMILEITSAEYSNT